MSEKQTEAQRLAALCDSEDIADSALLGNIESQFNACMHQEHCKRWKAQADQQHQHKPNWKLVPVEPTIRQMAAMGPAIRACYDMDGVSGNVVDVYRAMLAAAPKLPGEQPPTTEQSSAVQPQGEQEPRFFYDEEDALLWTPEEAQYGPEGMTALYTHPLPAQQPLSSARIDELIQEGVFGCNPYELVRRLEEERGVFKTRPLTDEQILEKVAYATRAERSMLLRFARAIERAHGIK